MRKLEGMAAYFFTCLGIVFLGCSILVVPESAFADHWVSECQDACCYSCFGTDECDGASSCYMGCTSDCFACASVCNENQSCIDECVQKAKQKCIGDPCEYKTNCFTQWVTNGSCDNKNTNCSEKGAADCGACICKKNTGEFCSCRFK